MRRTSFIVATHHSHDHDELFESSLDIRTFLDALMVGWSSCRDRWETLSLIRTPGTSVRRQKYSWSFGHRQCSEDVRIVLS